MADTNTPVAEDAMDGVVRDKDGEWQPATRPVPAPIFAWPPKPVEAFKWMFGFPGYLWPWNVVYMGIATVTWLYFQPALERCAVFQVDWIAEMFVRNIVMLVVIVGAWHIYFWKYKAQGMRYKYTSDWMETDSRKFLWGKQLWDNIFWSCASGGIIWTAYEVISMWLFANGHIPYVDPRAEPIYFVLVLCGIQFWRLFHFYWVHRLIHWKPLYKACHYLHHKNINIGPWSGLSMHPLEHLFYFSCIAIHWVVPSHPIHMLLNAQHAALTPAQGHVGFDKIEAMGTSRVPAASFFHQLHHRYFECNYGENDFPFDYWFGTFHDGSTNSHTAMREKRKAVHQI